jgi:hypothetical protein
MNLEATWEGEPALRALQKSAPAVGHNAPLVAVSSEPAYVRDAVPEPVDLAELVPRTRRP